MPRSSPGAPSRAFLAALVGATALHPISIQMFLPALPAIQRAFGVGAGAAQLTLSVSMLAIAGAMLVYGPLSDRYGRRPVLLAGQGLFVAGSLACAVAPSLPLLVGGRVLQAAGGCAGLVLHRAIVRDAYPLDRVTTVLAYLTLAMAVFPMFTPAVGGMLIDWVHWRAVFFAGAAVGVATIAAAVAAVGETRPVRSADGRAVGAPAAFAGLPQVLRSRDFWRYTGAGSFASACFFGFISAVPYLVIDVMGRSAREYGVWFIVLALAFMFGSFVAARVSERVGRDRMIALSALAMIGSGIALLALHARGLFQPAALFGPGMLITFAQGASGPNAQAGVVSGDPQHAGTASGLLGFVQTATAAGFAQVVGMAQDGTPLPMSLLVVAAGVGVLGSVATPRRVPC